MRLGEFSKMISDFKIPHVSKLEAGKIFKKA
jgi:hypothetical protein